MAKKIKSTKKKATRKKTKISKRKTSKKSKSVSKNKPSKTRKKTSKQTSKKSASSKKKKKSRMSTKSKTSKGKLIKKKSKQVKRKLVKKKPSKKKSNSKKTAQKRKKSTKKKTSTKSTKKKTKKTSTNQKSTKKIKLSKKAKNKYTPQKETAGKKLDSEFLNNPLYMSFIKSLVGDEGMEVIHHLNDGEISDVELTEKISEKVLKGAKKPKGKKPKKKKASKEKKTSKEKKSDKDSSDSPPANMKPNIVRKYLYSLYEAGIVSYRRHRSKSGWYTYYWTLHPERLDSAISDRYEIELKQLKELLTHEKENHFYKCKNECIRAVFEKAAEWQFKCPKCEETLDFCENKEKLNELEKAISEISKRMAFEN